MRKLKKMKMPKIPTFIMVLLIIYLATLQLRLTSDTAKKVDVEQTAVSYENGLTVHYIDVGQGDSTLLQCGEETMLIDAGEKENSANIIKYLQDLGINELTYVVATHPHDDHIGGLANVIKKIKPKNIIMPNATHTTKTFENLLNTIDELSLEITVPKPGDTYALGDAVLTALSPKDEEHENLNNYSVVLKAVYGKNSFLFTGDAERQIETQILEEGYDVKSDVLKCGHHGSKTSTSAKFLKAVSPKYAIISCGKDNDYGHPNEEVIKRLKDMGVEIKRTDELGTIIAKTNGESIAFTNIKLPTSEKE